MCGIIVVVIKSRLQRHLHLKRYGGIEEIDKGERYLVLLVKE